MNRLWGALTVLLIVIITVTTAFFINTNTAYSVSRLLSQSIDSAEKGDITSAGIFLQKAKSQWDRKMDIMLLFVSHGKLDQIEQTVNIAYSYIKSNDISNYMAQCQNARLLINNFREVEYPDIKNIF